MSQHLSQRPEQALQTGLAEHRAGRLEAARAIYGKVLESSPQDPNALHLMGLLSVQTGDTAGGLSMLHHSVALTPGNPEFALNLAKALKGAGRLEDAAQCLRQVLQAAPDSGDVHLELADILRNMKDPGAAETHYRKALDLGAEAPATLDKLAGVLIGTGREEEAEACFRQALEINPAHVPSLNNLGLLLVDRGCTEEAVDLHWRAAAILPKEADLWYNLGNALKARNALAEARDAYARAIDVNPDFAEAHLHTGFTWLLEGDFVRGWPECEWRWRARGFPTPENQGAKWDGGSLDGAVILLTAEQGLGDTIQFVRYAPMVAERGGRITLQVPPSLTGILRSVPGIDRVIATGDPPGAYRCHAPLMSLPHIFGTTGETLPAQVPYLTPDDALCRAWTERLGTGPPLKAGIVWRGFALHRNDRKRSCPLETFLPLTDVPGVRLFSLQKETTDDESPLPGGIEDLSGELGDFADTAAAIGTLDVVITVDTSVAHLAGAMGRPVWVLLPHNPDWRWMLDREDSPWYPTMRLFRQAEPGNWQSVIARIAHSLADEAQALGDRTRASGGAEEPVTCGAGADSQYLNG